MKSQARSAFCLSLLTALTAGAITGCSIDVIPVHYSRLNSAKRASEPLKRGPDAPGAFKKVWALTNPTGFLFDPSKIEFASGVARVKKPSRDRVYLETGRGAPFSALDGFTETLGAGNKGIVRYQLSNDGSKWYRFEGGKWEISLPSGDQANSAADINAHIQSFHTEVGAGQLYVKVFFISPTGAEPVELKEFQAAGVAPSTDGWD